MAQDSYIRGHTTTFMPRNPCAEAALSMEEQFATFPGKSAMDDDGGFLVPMHLTEELLKLLKPKEKAMKKFEYLEDMFLNVDHVESYWHELIEITPELSKGDIYHIEINLILSSGNEIVVDELPYVVSFLRAINEGDSNRGICDTKKTIAYYAAKAVEYDKTVKENEEVTK
jgi:hypothetical protein